MGLSTAQHLQFRNRKATKTAKNPADESFDFYKLCMMADSEARATFDSTQDPSTPKGRLAQLYRLHLKEQWHSMASERKEEYTKQLKEQQNKIQSNVDKFQTNEEHMRSIIGDGSLKEHGRMKGAGLQPTVPSNYSGSSR